MAPIHYVNGSFGADNTSDSTDPTTPTKTIRAALLSCSVPDCTIEITDEGSYNEGNLPINQYGTTVAHTASHLGRPRIYGRDIETRAFTIGNVTGTTFRGLEISHYTDYAFALGATAYRVFNLTGCFIHSLVGAQPQYASQNLKGTTADPNTIYESVIYFEHNGKSAGAIRVSAGVLDIRNSLITASFDRMIVEDYGGANITASYSTFINRHPSTTETILRASKVRNCIVSGASANGVASDNHNYNLIYVGGTSFLEHDNSTPDSNGDADITGQDPLFVDGTETGSSPAIAGYFQLQEASPAVGYAEPIGILFDISGNTRPEGGDSDPGSEDWPDMGCFEYQYVPDPAWSSYGTQSSPGFDSNFTINLYQNLTSNYKLPYASASSPGQVPFSLGPKGPGTLRGRLGAYGVSKGGDPSTIIQTSSA